MNIKLKENEWALIVDVETGDRHVKMSAKREVTDEVMQNVVVALMSELCYVCVGFWQKKEMLDLIGTMWDDTEKTEKKVEQKKTRKKQGKRDD